MLEKIRNIIVQYVDVKPEELTPEIEFRGDLGLTSLAMMNMLVEIEDEFGIEVEEDAALEFEKLQDLMDYLSEHGITE